MSVKRLFVEKKKGFDVEAQEKLAELHAEPRRTGKRGADIEPL